MALPKEFHDLAAKVRNWGRWGPESGESEAPIRLLTVPA